MADDAGADEPVRPRPTGRRPQRRADAGRVRAAGPLPSSRGQPGTGSATSPGSTAARRSRPRRARPSWSASSAWCSSGSRLGIPALVHEECLTGFTTYGATVYPAAIAWGATFDPDLVERMAAAIGRDMAALGVHQGLSPVLDVVRDYRWGRVEETIGEDPYLVAMLGRRLRPRAAERRRHRHPQALRRLLGLPGGPQPRPGVDGPARAARRHPAAVRDGRAPGRRRLGDELLLRRRRRPGRRRPLAAHRDAARRVGLRRHGRLRLLGGAVPGDACTGSPPTPTRPGALALDRRHRRRAARHARLRPAAGRAGSAAASCREALVDRAAAAAAAGRRCELGLLDPDWTPEASVAGARRRRPRLAGQPGAGPRDGRALGRPARRRAPRCRCSARADRRCAGSPSVGPCADDPRTFMGCYAFPNHVLPRLPGLGLGHRGADRRSTRCGPSCPDVEVVYEQGCAVQGRRPLRLRRRRSRPPAAADVCVAFVGDLAGLFGRGTSGEGCDAEDLRLPGVQAELLAELLATGTPVVVVVVSGRPYALGRRARAGRRPGAGVHAGRGGRRGDRRRAVRPGAARRQAAGADPAPAGRPAGHLPAAAAGRRTAPASATSTRRRCSRSATARSYTTFEVDDLRISDAEMPTDGEFTVAGPGAQHRRAGPATRSSSSTCTTCVAQVTRPVRQLAGFARVRLEPGEAADVRLPACTPTGPPSPAATCGGSSSPGTSRCSSGPPRPTCPAGAASGSPVRLRDRRRTTAGWSPRWRSRRPRERPSMTSRR